MRKIPTAFGRQGRSRGPDVILQDLDPGPGDRRGSEKTNGKPGEPGPGWGGISAAGKQTAKA